MGGGRIMQNNQTLGAYQLDVENKKNTLLLVASNNNTASKEARTRNVFDHLAQAEKLFANREILQTTYIPDVLPHREKEMNDLAAMLVPALRMQAPSNVIIYGLPGTGKTALAKIVGKELESKGLENGHHIFVIYLNCHHIDTQHRVLQNIAKHFTKEQSDHNCFVGLPTDEVYSKTLALVDGQKCVAVVILDEVDKLKDDAALYTLTRINDNLKQSKVSVICISNNLRFTEFLDSRIQSSLGEENLIFSPYDAQQLQDILRERAKLALKPYVLDDGAIPLCAALAAQDNGDARRALDLLRVAAELAERNNDIKVTIRHVRQAQNKIERDRIAEVICGLPDQQKLVLYAIWRLHIHNKRNNTPTVASTGEIYNAYTDLSKAVRYNPLTQRRVADFISELDTIGVITARVISKGRHGRTREIELSSSIDLTNILQQDNLFAEISQYKIKNQSRLI